MQAQDLVQRVASYDSELARDLKRFLGTRHLGLVYEESKPEYVRLVNKPVVVGDIVNILPPRGVAEDMINDDDEHDAMWYVASINEDGSADLVSFEQDEKCTAQVDDLIAVSRFDQTIYCGLAETGRVERGGDKPYNIVINGENFHALEALMYSYKKKVTCIYLDPPYNNGSSDWKYNNNYVSADDTYRHSKWLTFMEDRLTIARELLDPECSALIVTIDEKEYLRLGLLLEQMFPDAKLRQMVTLINKPEGTSRRGEFSRTNEFVYFLTFGSMAMKPFESNMFTEPKPSSGQPMPWDNLRRRNAANVRHSRPNQFYPIFISKEDGHIVEIGNAMGPDEKKEDVIAPDGSFAMFPLKPDGTEMLWGKQPSTLRRLLSLGYVKVEKWDKGPKRTIVKYITEGRERDIAEGKAIITDRGPQGEIIAEYVDESTKSPRSVWNMPSHNAQTGGTLLLKALLGDNRFTFPKSLYAVEDCLRFFVADKKDAIVLDFFAGSATTAHAVMRLNHQDGGSRQSISVTNNEVSYEEAQELTARGLRAGDEEWEHLGICRYVAVPRVIAAITGCMPDGEQIDEDKSYGSERDYYVEDEEDAAIPKSDIDEAPTLYVKQGDDYIEASQYVAVEKSRFGRERKLYVSRKLPDPAVPDQFPMRDGFNENAVFYDLVYLEPSVIAADLAFNEIAPLLWMQAGSRGKVIFHCDTYEITDTYAVLFDYSYAAPFIRECHERGVDYIYVVTDIDANYRHMYSEFRGKNVRQLYKSYLRSFEIGTSR